MCGPSARASVYTMPTEKPLVSTPQDAVVRPTYMSRRQTAEYLNITERTVDRMIADGKLTAVRIGPRLIRIPVSSIEALLAGGDE